MYCYLFLDNRRQGDYQSTKALTNTANKLRTDTRALVDEPESVIELELELELEGPDWLLTLQLRVHSEL